MRQLFSHQRSRRRQQSIRPRLEILEDRTLLNSSSATLAFSTYLGGSDYDAASAVAVDASGNVYVTGTTNSAKDFPILNSYQPILRGSSDAFVAKYDASGNLVWSTYLGGSQDEGGNAIAVDSSGNVYVAGETSSSDFPTTAGAIQTQFHGSSDAFVVKFSPSGTLTYSTFLGGRVTLILLTQPVSPWTLPVISTSQVLRTLRPSRPLPESHNPIPAASSMLSFLN